MAGRKKRSAGQTRAQELRAEIERLTEDSPAPPVGPESPAAFVHRRMAELAEAEKKRAKSRPR